MSNWLYPEKPASKIPSYVNIASCRHKILHIVLLGLAIEQMQERINHNNCIRIKRLGEIRIDKI